MEREKGVMAPCYSCGKALETAEQPDGGMAAVPCQDCEKPEKAKREKGVIEAPADEEVDHGGE